jgi:hypothetical protein
MLQSQYMSNNLSFATSEPFSLLEVALAGTVTMLDGKVGIINKCLCSLGENLGSSLEQVQ